MSLFDSKDREKITKFLDEYAQQVSRDEKLAVIEWIDRHLGLTEWYGNVDYEEVLSQFENFNHQNQER
jgi:hypothetical protein